VRKLFLFCVCVRVCFAFCFGFGFCFCFLFCFCWFLSMVLQVFVSDAVDLRMLLKLCFVSFVKTLFKAVVSLSADDRCDSFR